MRRHRPPGPNLPSGLQDTSRGRLRFMDRGGNPVPYRHLRESAASNTMSGASMRRRTQVAKGEVCKTSIQRFESARRLHLLSAA